MYSTIKAQVVDQTLQLVSIPTLASGGVNENRVEFTFCGLWDGLGKVAVFYRDKDNVYQVPLVGNACMVPHEVTAEEGNFWLGVFGSSDEETRTTEVQQLTVEQGAITVGAEYEPPAPSLYQKLLAAYGEQDARINALVKSQGVGATQTVELTTTVFNQNGEDCRIQAGTDGIHGWVRIYNVNLTLAAGEVVTLYDAGLPALPLGMEINWRYQNISVEIGTGDRISLRNPTASELRLEDAVIYSSFPLQNPSLLELNDARAGHDGTEYETAGEHVRAIGAQVADLVAAAAYKFEAVYGETSYDHILENFLAGVPVSCRMGAYSFPLLSIEESSRAAYFGGSCGSFVTTLTCMDNEWTAESTDGTREFVAIYGATTFAEIDVAVFAGKNVLMQEAGGTLWNLSGRNAERTKYFFLGVFAGRPVQFSVDGADSWERVYL